MHWIELKPSLSAAVRHCDHCNRKVYLCRTDADIKLYTSVNYCITIADSRAPADNEGGERSKDVIGTNSSGISPHQGVRLIGVMLPTDNKQLQARIQAVENEMDMPNIPRACRQLTGVNITLV